MVKVKESPRKKSRAPVLTGIELISSLRPPVWRAPWGNLPITLDKRAISTYSRLQHMAHTREGLRTILRIRYKKHLARLPKSARARWLETEITKFFTLPDEMRCEQLFERWVDQGWWRELRIIDETGRPFGVIWRALAVPYVALHEADGSEAVIPIGLSVPKIRERVDTFVREQRQITGQLLHRGRKAGRRGAGFSEGDWMLAVLLAYLVDHRRMKRAELLRLCNRETTPDAYKWLSRRLAVGRPVVRERELADIFGIPLISMRSRDPISEGL